MTKKVPNLLLKSGIYYFNKRVPNDIIDRFGKKHLRFSLETSDAVVAKNKQKIYAGEFEKLWGHMRKTPDKESFGARLVHVAQEYQRLIELGQMEKMTADHLWGIDVERFVRQEYAVDLEKGEEHLLPANVVEQIHKADALVKYPQTRLLSQAIHLYLENKESRVAVSTLISNRKVLNNYFAYSGDVDVKTITKFKAADYVNRQIIPAKGEPKTKREKVSALSTFFDWCETSGYVTENVFKGLTRLIVDPVSGESSEDDRRPYTYHELYKMISYLRHYEDRRCLPFFLIALYSGMRSNEIASIELEEVYLRQRYIFIPRGKTESSVREVPVHPVIDPLLKYLCKTTSDTFILPALKRGGYDKKRNHYIVKEFSRIKEALKLPIPYHCTRNTFCGILENADVQESTAQQIVGHKKKSLTFSLYSGGIKPHNLCKVVDSLHYDQRFERYVSAVIAEYCKV